MESVSKKVLFTFVITILCALPLSAEYNKWNNALGITLLNKSAKWDQRAFENVFWQECRVHFRGNGQLRTAFPRECSVLGQNVFEIRAVYDNSGQLSVVDLVFNNKGDNADARRIRRVIRDTARDLEKKLTALGGTPVKSSYGHKKLGNSAKRWNLGETEFFLEYASNEFVMLHICYPSGKKMQMQQKDFSVRNMDVGGNVISTLYGDVYIENIPMVNQGSKGYCVPATVERVLRYYGINNINMHQLADAGKTRQGGGTDPQQMFKGISAACRRSGLKMIKTGNLRMKMIKKYIDNGIPIFWSMYTNQEYEELRKKSRQLRPTAAPLDKWRSQNKKERVPQAGEGHMCLIIGYNTRSNEIAVSNSWGEHEIKPSWIPLHIAHDVSQGKTVVLLPR